MCGRYSLTRGDRIVEVVPNVTIRADLRRVLEGGRFNIAPTQEILVALQPAPGKPPEAAVMKWGLIPSWAKDASIASKLINARAETLAEKPSFRQALQRRRCVIPADGFYEWRKNAGGSKTPMYATLRSGKAFGFAGLWDTWRDPDGKQVQTCTIITTAPNALMSPVHNRMPAILDAEGLRTWLDPAVTDAHDLAACLKPYRADQMQMHPVGRRVNTAGAEGADLIAPVEEQPETPPARTPRTRGKEDPCQGTLGDWS